MARCPAHDDRSPSLSIGQTRDGRPLVHCFAGCKGPEVIAALRASGLWDGGAYRDPSYMQGYTVRHDGADSAQDRERRQAARDIWDRSSPARGTLVETYLRSRGIKSPAPDCLRFMPRFFHAPSGKSFPCMVASLVERNSISAVQCTYLLPDGSGKAQVEGPKRTRGPMGRSAVRLGKPAEIMGLAEGIETALSAKQIYQIPTWAVLSAHRLSKIELPPECKSLVIFADQGAVGMENALEAARHYEGEGIDVDVMPPSVHFGKADDFNTALRG